MKKQMLCTIFAVAFTLATATEGLAQSTQVFWSTPASGCVVQTGSQGATDVSAVFGTVSFASGHSGDIKLTCPVPLLASVDSPYVYPPNQLTLTYYDDNSFDGTNNHCYIFADLLRSNLNNLERGGDPAMIRAANQVTSGRQTLSAFLSESMDMQSSFYWVDVQLHRDAPNAACNPTVVGAYLSYVDVIQ